MNKLIPKSRGMKILFFCVVILTVLFEAPPLRAAPLQKTNKDTRRTSSFYGKIETGITYDSNIFQSKIRDVSDQIWKARVTFTYRINKVRWTGFAIRNQYIDNSELSNTFFMVGVVRPFGSRDFGSLFLRIRPTALLDLEERNSVPLRWKSNGFRTRYSRKLTSLLKVGLSFSYDRLDYTEGFDAKDSDLIKIGLFQNYRFKRSWYLLGEYTFEAGLARGGASVDPNFQDDISYRAHVGAVQVSYQWMPSTSIRVRYWIRSKAYTTDLPLTVERFHPGRTDTNHLIRVGLRYKATPKVIINTRLMYLWRNSTDPRVKYTKSIYTVSASYQF
ncbi:MAG: hypothetical protein ABGX83_07140 [Nitrospira sp.]|nr:hypothetical protein [Candidatus Manganitrophaceae bacterium]